MKLKELLVNICNISIKEKLVQSAMSGTSLYNINPKSVKFYPLLFASPTGQHIIKEHTTTFTITLYYFDRLLEDLSNDIDIYSTAIEELKNIVKAIENLQGVLKVNDQWRCTNFNDTESFNDALAGAWCTIEIVTDNETECQIISE